MLLTESNYFSTEAEKEYCSSSQYRSFVGTMGKVGCEARTLSKIEGKWTEEVSNALLVGSYVDAHFSGTLNIFKAQHPEIFTKKTGELLAPFKHADVMIARCERDKLFMKTLSGGSQEIFTVEMFGLKWKCKVDSYHEHVAIVDLKTTASIMDTHYTKEFGRINFIRLWGYDIQLAIYQKIVELVTGEKLPVFIAAVSKEPEPDIEVIGFQQELLDEVLLDVKNCAARIVELKNGAVEPRRCGICDYCKNTKVLTKIVDSADIGEKK